MGYRSLCNASQAYPEPINQRTCPFVSGQDNGYLQEWKKAKKKRLKASGGLYAYIQLLSHTSLREHCRFVVTTNACQAGIDGEHPFNINMTCVSAGADGSVDPTVKHPQDV